MATSDSEKKTQLGDQLQSLDVETFSDAFQARAQHASLNEKKELAKTALGVLSPGEKKDVIEEVQGFVGASNITRDYLWKVIIWSFAIVLVGSFFTIALDVIVPYWVEQEKNQGASAQLMLTVFTSVVGFLAGLFTPSPAARTRD